MEKADPPNLAGKTTKAVKLRLAKGGAKVRLSKSTAHSRGKRVAFRLATRLVAR